MDPLNRGQRTDRWQVARLPPMCFTVAVFRFALDSPTGSELANLSRTDICDRRIGGQLETLDEMGGFLVRANPYGAAALYDDIPRVDTNMAKVRFQFEGPVRFDGSGYVLWHPVGHREFPISPGSYATAVRLGRKMLILCHRVSLSFAGREMQVGRKR